MATVENSYNLIAIMKRYLQWCSGAGTHGNGVPTYEIEWERRSHKRNFEIVLLLLLN